MKLQRQLSRKTKNKEYDKWVLVMPPSIVKKAGLEEGDEFDPIIKNKKIVLSKRT